MFNNERGKKKTRKKCIEKSVAANATKRLPANVKNKVEMRVPKHLFNE